MRLAPILLLTACVPLPPPPGARPDANAIQIDTGSTPAQDAALRPRDALAPDRAPPTPFDGGQADVMRDAEPSLDANPPDASPRDSGLTDAGPLTCDPVQHRFPNANARDEPGDGGCPTSMARVDNFCVDRFEASLVEVRPDGSTRPWSPYHHPGSRTVRAVSLRGAVPQGYVDGDTAARACAQAGKRLCTDTEWLRACRGPRGLTFPYGAARQDGVCNDARRRHPAVELFPNDPNPFARIQDACINQLPDSVHRTAVNLGCITTEGVFDMMGNLHEWTADPQGTFRGGFYVDTRRNGPGCLYRTTAHNTLHWDYSTGFRCCADLP